MKGFNKIIYSVLGIVVLFLVYEFFFIQKNSFQVFGEENGVVFQMPSGEVITFGDQTSEIQSTLRSIRPYFSSAPVLRGEEQKTGTEIWGNSFQLQIVTPHIFRLYAENSVFWILTDSQEEELSALKKERISLESDFWILFQKNGFVDENIPFPREGILFLGKRKPLKVLREFALKTRIPLLDIQQTGGMWLTKKDEKWIVRVRK